MTLDDWIAHHATLFGLTTDSELQMVRAWRALFEREGFQGDELIAASNWLLMNRGLCYRGEHATLLTEYVRWLRGRNGTPHRIADLRARAEADEKQKIQGDLVKEKLARFAEVLGIPKKKTRKRKESPPCALPPQTSSTSPPPSPST